MRVVAVDKGYFGRIREIDDEFDVPKDLKASWFRPVSADKKTAPAKKGGEADDAPDLS